MAFTRKFLSALGIEQDKIDEIIAAHTEVTDALKTERDKFKEDAEKLPDIKAELEKFQEAAKKGDKDAYKVKYEAIKEEFEEFKKGIEAKETTAKKEDAYKRLLKEAGVSEKRIPAILKVSDIESIELDGEGNAKGADKLTETIKAEWSDFIQTTKTEGAKVANPPANNGKATMTKEQIRAIEDPIARQKAMLENRSAVGLPEKE